MGRRHSSVRGSTYDVSSQLVLFISLGMIALSLANVNVLPSKCSVATIFGLKTADCRNSHLRSIPATMAADMKVLRFTDNQLTFLGIDAFHAYQALQHIYLGRNRIQTIAPDAFRALRNLQILNLEANRLRTIPTPAFQHISSVRILSLKSNPIAYITTDAFLPLSNLEELNLENCWLNRVQPGAFAGLSQLGELNLVNNELAGLPSETELDLPGTLTVLRLHRNPWNCDCRLRWLRRLVHVRGSSTSESSSINWDFAAHNTPVCAGPDLLRGVSWRHLDPDQFACPPSQVVGNGTTSVEIQVGSNASIACVVGGDPPPDVTWMKGTDYVDARRVARKNEVPAGNSKESLIHSVLSLTHVTTVDAGDYKCVAANPAGRSEVTYKVWVVEGQLGGGTRQQRPRDGRNTEDLEDQSLFSDEVEVVFGVTVGITILLVVVCSCAVLVVLRKRQVLQNLTRGRKEHGTTGNSYVLAGNTTGSLKSNHVVADATQIDVTQTWNGRQGDVHRMLPNACQVASETIHVAPFQTLADDDPAASDDVGENLPSQFAMKIFDPPNRDPPIHDDDIPSPTADMTPSPPPPQPADPSQFHDDDCFVEAVPQSSKDLTGSRQHEAAAAFGVPESDVVTSFTTSRADDDHGSDPVESGPAPTSHCVNPVCLRDRLLEKDKMSTSSLPQTDLCSHRLALSSHSHTSSPEHAGLRVTIVQRPNVMSGYVVDVDSSSSYRSPSGAVRVSTNRRNSASSRAVDPSWYSTLPLRRQTAEDQRSPRGSHLVPTAVYRSTMPRQHHIAYERPLPREHTAPNTQLSGSSSALDVRDMEAACASYSVLGSKSPNTVPPVHVATSINDILSPPFGPPPAANGPKPTTGKKALKPGEHDEFGTAV